MPETIPQIAVIIPARYDSERLPGKPLADLGGRPMIQHVVERCQRARGLSRVIVATDDQRIADTVRAFGAQAELTSKDCRSGTDRVAELARRLSEPFFINVQGDEPLIEPFAIEELAHALRQGAQLATLCRPAQANEDLSDPSSAKVVLDEHGDALYFSRAPIPHFRGGRPEGALSFVHVGIYGYAREVLFQLAALPQGRLERAEKLEQLRALEHGLKLRVVPTPYVSVSVDTPEDLIKVRGLLSTDQRVLH